MRHALLAALAGSLLALAACGAPAPASTLAPAAMPPIAASAGPACAVGRADCDGQAANGCEQDIDFAVNACGRCGAACSDGERCVFGRCRRGGALASSDAHGCGLAPGGAVRCWGDNVHGELGDGKPTLDKLGPAALPVLDLLVPSVGHAVAVTVGGDLVFGRSSCALDDRGQVSCWGVRAPAPKPVPAFSSVIDLAVGTGRLCVVLRGGTVSCADVIQRGDFDLPRYDAIHGVDDAVQVVIRELAGGHHACALRRSGQVLCWGEAGGAFGSTVVGKLDARHEIRAVSLEDAVELASGPVYDCAVRRGGGVACWGVELDGNLGGKPASDGAVMQVPSIQDAIEAATGAAHACALHRTGEVSCWGRGERGQLGDGHQENRATPVKVAGLRDAVHLIAGYDASCALRRSGELVCWGDEKPGLRTVLPRGELR